MSIVTFDPRHTWIDNPDSLERWLIHKHGTLLARLDAEAQTATKRHAAELAAMKSAAFRLVNRCAICGLELKCDTRKTRCATCQAKEAIARKESSNPNGRRGLHWRKTYKDQPLPIGMLPE